MLVRLLYASRSVQPIDDSFIEAILDRSAAKNQEHGITGVLCSYADGDVFLQALEGGRDEVNALYNNIVRDQRHRDTTLLHYTEIQERRFAAWRMGRVELNSVNLRTILRFSTKAQLDPFSLSGPAAWALLEELSSAAAIASADS
ncbi:MAG: BLUF domain-containing protein [Candidatus Eisenbacteria bacterium]|uniref:BLUF domain-containing protein n=1 Tax=Eiseniibacteriota bacterium TaxID=2212470 RepID=A0A956M1C4_UNCEI|nr:BLUF domain-containing protein [Candidatus Eisenbacteria bacterium]